MQNCHVKYKFSSEQFFSVITNPPCIGYEAETQGVAGHSADLPISGVYLIGYAYGPVVSTRVNRGGAPRLFIYGYLALALTPPRFEAGVSD